METKTIINLLIRIFSLMALGFILKRKGLIDDKIQKGLSNLLISVFMPASILTSSSNPIDAGMINEITITTIISFIYYLSAFAILIPILRKFSRKMDIDKQGVFTNLIIFANSSFMGYPIVENLFGKQAVIIAVVFNMFWVLTFFTIGITIMKGEKSFNLLLGLKTPVTISSFITLIIYFSPFRLPEVITTTLADIGGMVTPVSMIIIGAILSDIPIKSLFTDSASLLISGLRLLVIPILGIFILQPFKIPSLTYKTIIILLAMPCASIVTIYADLYNKEPEFAARTNSLSTALFAFSFPLILLLINIFI